MVGDIDQRRTQIWEAIHAEDIIESEGSGRLIDLILGYMDDSDVGPWLVHRLATEESPEALTTTDKRTLVTRARALSQVRSIDLFLADLEVHWGANEDSGYRTEGPITEAIDRLALEKLVLQDPVHADLQSLFSRLRTGRAWTAFAFFETLCREHPGNRSVLWHKALTARGVGRRQDYFEAAILSLGPKGDVSDGISAAVVANGLISLRLDGLALALAEMTEDPESSTSKDLIRLAAANCRLRAWEWPCVLHRAVHEEENDKWVDAADQIIRCILSAPTSWAACKAFLSVFTRPLEQELDWGDRSVDIALSVVQHVLKQPRYRQEPELLVLRAELIYARTSKRIGAPVAEAVLECEQLCLQAQRVSAGFQPAILLQQRMQQAQEAPLAPGETFDNRYLIEYPMSPGSFGQVYRARVIGAPAGFPDIVALKRIRAEAATPEKRQQRVRALAQEAKIAIRLDHPNIVKTFEFIQGQGCLVMEFIDGETLSERIQKRLTMPWAAAARVGLQIASALRFAGDVARRDFDVADFAHRDIHPGT